MSILFLKKIFECLGSDGVRVRNRPACRARLGSASLFRQLPGLPLPQCRPQTLGLGLPALASRPRTFVLGLRTEGSGKLRLLLFARRARPSGSQPPFLRFGILVRGASGFAVPSSDGVCLPLFLGAVSRLTGLRPSPPCRAREGFESPPGRPEGAIAIAP